MIGYRSARYAHSLSEFGLPVFLPASGGWVLEREIGATGDRDAMGCYPLFTCANWPALSSDLHATTDRFVSLSLVVDPFAPVSEADLRETFDVVLPFKEHFVIDAQRFDDASVSKHHRYYARRSLRALSVSREEQPATRLDDWCRLYGVLVNRHGLRGIKAFSRTSFAEQLCVPGLVMFLASGPNGPVGAHLWIVENQVAYSHLAAFDDAGYAVGAAYALYWEAIRTFRDQMRAEVSWIDLGAGAGTTTDGTDGLTAFKRGWTPTTRTKFFCGRVLDRGRYDRLSEAAGTAGARYFPAYRFGEF